MSEITLINQVLIGTNGFIYIFLTENVIRLPMVDKDYENVINYMELTREGIKLKTKAATEKEIKLKKAYNYLYHRQRQLLTV